MFEVGPVDDAGKKLIAVTYGAWQEAAKFCEPGKQYRDIGGIIEDYAAQHGFSTVRNFCGHGIGSVCKFLCLNTCLWLLIHPPPLCSPLQPQYSSL